MRNFSTLILLFCMLFLSAQENSVEKEEKQYTVSELDSLLPVMLNYYNKGEFQEILLRVPRLIKNAQDINASTAEIRFKNFLGNTFIKLGDSENASKYFNESLNASLKQNDSTGVITMYVSLGNAYFKDQPDKAIHYYNKALNYNYNGERKAASLFIIHHNLAETYVKQGLIKEAKHHLNLIKDKVDEQEPPQLKELFRGTVLSIEANIQLLEKQYELAIETAKKSLKSNKEYDREYEATNYKTLISSFENLKNYEQAYFYNKKYDSLRSVQYEQEKILAEQIARAKVHVDLIQNELTQVELENDISQQRAEFNNMLILFFGLLASTLLVVAILLYREKKKRDHVLDVLTEKNNEYLMAKNESEELARKNTRFLSTISHELRTPLYGIVGLTTSFLKDPRLKDLSGDLSSLKFSADYLLALVNDVLNINKFSSTNGMEIIEKHFDITRLLNNIKDSFRFLNEKHNNIVTIELDDNVPNVINGDYTKISQVLMNLMSNASKFTEDGTITIAVQLIDSENEKFKLNFEISDTGRGIHPDDQKQIFEEFMQIKGSNDFEIAGTGLGIPIVSKILHLLGSELKLESELNKGSTFSFDLLVQEGDINELKEEIESDRLKSLHGLKVLIVDDNKINQLVTKKVLELHKMIHHTASNGREAVEICSNFDFDFILMDINMPVMNGIEATVKIRKFNKEIPIIALTATNFEDPEKEIYCHGFDSVVVKPYNNDHLIQAFLQHINT